MDHDEAVRQNATERYLLQELDPGIRDQFEEHLFECQDCALDLRTAAMFVEQSKIALAEAPGKPATVAVPNRAKAGWFSWFRPQLAAPVFALLLIVILYQNLVQVPHLELAANQPEAVPYASINVSTRGTVQTQVTVKPDQGYNLLVSIPPDAAFSAYTLDLYKPDGGLQWSLKVPASSPDETRSIHIPGAGLKQGTYKLVVNGIASTGQSSTIGTYPIELQIQK